MSFLCDPSEEVLSRGQIHSKYIETLILNGICQLDFYKERFGCSDRPRLFKCASKVQIKLELNRVLFGSTAKTLKGAASKRVESYYQAALDLMEMKEEQKGYCFKVDMDEEVPQTLDDFFTPINFNEPIKGRESKSKQVSINSTTTIFSLPEDVWNNNLADATKGRIAREERELAIAQATADSLGVDVNDLPEREGEMKVVGTIEIPHKDGVYKILNKRSRKNESHERIYNIFTFMESEERAYTLTQLYEDDVVEIDINSEVSQNLSIREHCPKVRELIKRNELYPTDYTRDHVKLEVNSSIFAIKSPKKEFSKSYRDSKRAWLYQFIEARAGSIEATRFVQGVDKCSIEGLFSLEKHFREFQSKHRETTQVHDALYIGAKNREVIEEFRAILDALGIAYKVKVHRKDELEAKFTGSKALCRNAKNAPRDTADALLELGVA